MNKLNITTIAAAIALALSTGAMAQSLSKEDYKAGKEKALGFLVGQIMKQTKGRANPAIVNKMLKEQIN